MPPSIYLPMLLLTIAIFIADLLTPLGVAIGVLYVVVVLLSLRSSSRDIAFDNCSFTAAGTSIDAARVNWLTVSHCRFTEFQHAAVALNDCSQIHLSGNLFDNAKGPALKLANSESPRYSNYNCYRDAVTAWEVAGKKLSLADVQKHHDQQSRTLVPNFVVTDGVARLNNAELFAAGGPLGKPLGPYRDEARRTELVLVRPPVVHSVSATTANIEWTSSLPASCQLAWGETPACDQTATFEVNCFGTYSLTGLKPDRKYFFRIKSLEIPKPLAAKIEAKPVKLKDEPLSFVTLAKNPAPAVYYVATDGDDTRSGLDRQPHLGPQRKLTPKQFEKVRSLVLKATTANGFATELWTGPRVAQLIQGKFQVTYHSRYLPDLLRKLGFSCQKPERQARQRDDQAVAERIDRDWKRIKKTRDVGMRPLPFSMNRG